MMATPMSSLLEELSRDHFPHPPATPEQIEEFERRVGQGSPARGRSQCGLVAPPGAHLGTSWEWW